MHQLIVAGRNVAAREGRLRALQRGYHVGEVGQRNRYLPGITPSSWRRVAKRTRALRRLRLPNSSRLRAAGKTRAILYLPPVAYSLRKLDCA